MPPNLPSFLSSRTFEIVSRNRSFFVHGDVLSAQSESLRRITADVAAESKINLSDWDSNTVERFLQFLYVGDYNVPEPTEEGEGGEGLGSGQDGAMTPDTVQSLADHEEWVWGLDVNVLLVHAKVYVLAEFKGVEGLRVMALGRLKMALEEVDSCGSILDGTSKPTEHVIELLWYIYTYTNTKAHQGSGEAIRDVVSKFTAANVENLMGHERVKFLLIKGGDFAGELMEKVMGRLCDLKMPFKGRSCDIEKEVQELGNRAAALDEKVRQLEAANAEMRQELEAKVRQLEAEVRKSEDKARQLEAISAAKIRQLGTADAGEPRVGTPLPDMENIILWDQDFLY